MCDWIFAAIALGLWVSGIALCLVFIALLDHWGVLPR
jgi:hypothetical protein